MLVGVALAGIAAFAYPRREDLELERPRYVTVGAVDDFLRRECATLAQSLGEADAEDLRAAWSAYARLTPTRFGERSSHKSSQYWVRSVLGFLAESGMARQDNTSDVDRWILTDRFRLHVADLAGSAAYDTLAEIASRAGTSATTLSRAPTPTSAASRPGGEYDAGDPDEADPLGSADGTADEAAAEHDRIREVGEPPSDRHESPEEPDAAGGQEALL